MSTEAARYARITHRLATGVSSEDDEASRVLAAVFERRIIESISTECAPYVTSDLLSERMAQAVAALGVHDITLRLADGAVLVDGCFCEANACDHPAALLQRLLGAEIEPITTQDGRRALQVIGVFDAAVYTREASSNVFKG